MTMTMSEKKIQCPRRPLTTKKVDTNSVLQSLIFFPQCWSYLQAFKIVKSSSFSKECKNKETSILTYNFFWHFSTNLILVVLSFTHSVLNHFSAYMVFYLHGCFSKVSKNSVSRGPPVYLTIKPTLQLQRKPTFVIYLLSHIFRE